MIGYQLKLKLTIKQEKTLEQWLFHLTGVWNWAVRKIELDAKDKIYHSDFEIKAMVKGHSKIGVSSDAIREMVMTAWTAWRSCFKKISKKPRLKGQRNRLNSIPLREGFGRIDQTHFAIHRLGVVNTHKQEIPDGEIKCCRIIKRPSGWYLSIVIDTESKPIPVVDNSLIGIDSGFNNLLTLSTGEKIPHPREFEQAERRLGQAQRGKNQRLANRIQERIANKRKDRNHKLSRELVSNNRLIAFSADKHKSIAKIFGKSVGSSGHYQLRSMLAYKCRSGGRQYIEVPSKNSTRTCSACGVLSGPTGFTGLKVRNWVCSCGAEHDRDVNAAVNTLKAGLGMSHENVVRRVRNLKSKRSSSTR